MGEYEWKSDPKPIREFVELARAEGFQPSSIDQGHSVLLRYDAFLRRRYHSGLERSGWRELAAYKAHLGQTGIKRSSLKGYLGYIVSYYRLRAESLQDSRSLNTYARAEMIGRVFKAPSEPWTSFSPETLDRILTAAKREYRARRRNRSGHSEEFPFVMTLLYTGGRAQFYGLRTREVDFDRMEITTKTKGGVTMTIPLHPTLAHVLREHLLRRGYRSEFLFRHGHDSATRLGQKANRQNAWRACKRIQEVAHLSEQIHPHRFRKTFATMGRRLGVDPRCIQAVLGHRNLRLTLDLYSRMDLDEVKQELARVELAPGKATNERGSRTKLRLALPPGKERALEMVVQGLIGLLQPAFDPDLYDPAVQKKRRRTLLAPGLRRLALAESVAPTSR